MDFDAAKLRLIAIKLVVLIISFALHEWGHAIAAAKLGDHTPRSQGRTTLNPFAHLDLIGSIVIPLMGALGAFGSLGILGWAKPVMVNHANLRRGYIDQTIVTLAGPGMNLVIALLAAIGLGLFHPFGIDDRSILGTFLEMNVGLLVLNMLPIPPLDGSKIYVYAFGVSEAQHAKYAMAGSIGLLVLFNLPAFRHLFEGMVLVAAGPFLQLRDVIAGL